MAAEPRKLVALLSHNYTTAALETGLHALKGRDRVISNLLDSARRIHVANDGDGWPRKSSRASIDGPKDGGASSKTNQQDDEPYAFDVFVILMRGVAKSGEADGAAHTTGPMIPLLPGNPRVFSDLANRKSGRSKDISGTHHYTTGLR